LAMIISNIFPKRPTSLCSLLSTFNEFGVGAAGTHCRSRS
jgi:hypothetical protein